MENQYCSTEFMTTEAIEVEATPMQTQALVVRQEQAVGLFGTTEPVAVIEKATKVADALKNVIVKQGLVSKISGKEYPRCEAWTLLGTMLGVFPVTVWTKEKEGGWEARVEARTKDGAVIGAAEAECLRSERNWKDRDDFALRSMAQTRATAKCLRMPLGFVMTLAGFEATPAEEMTAVENRPGPMTSRERFSRAAHQNAPGRAGGVSEQGEAAKASPASTGASGQANKTTSPKTITPQQAIFADDQTRARMIAQFQDSIELATEYFQKAGCILETEKLEDLPLRFVPVTRRQFQGLQACITGFGNGEEANLPYPPNPEPAPPPVQKAPPQTQKAAAPVQKATSQVQKTESLPQKANPQPTKDPEWFFTVICPIPQKGQKRDEYLKHPDTILSLYRRMKEGDEGAQKRLWGFAKHWAPAARQVGNRTYEPSAEDLKFREALDAFCEWEEKHGKDTAAGEEQQDFPDYNKDDNDIPF